MAQLNDEQQLAQEKAVPEIRTFWVSVYCAPDEKLPRFMRLKVDLELNGEFYRSLADTLIDRIAGNGIICQSHNLTWIRDHLK